MLLLIGLALFLHPECFCFAYIRIYHGKLWHISYIRTTARGFDVSHTKCYIYQNIPMLQGYTYTTVALYDLSAFNEITKCIISLLRDIRICLWVSFLGLNFYKFIGDYLRDGSLIMPKKLCIY